MSSRWTGFFIWFLVAASTAFWGFKIFAATRPVPSGAQAPMAAIPPAGPMERLFGAIVLPTAPVVVQHPESERFQLVGVIDPRGSAEARGGLAIVAIDGAPAKPWHVGSTLDGNTTLLSVAKRTADFGPAGGPTAFTLQLPEPSAPETGSMPVAVSQPDGLQAPAPSVQPDLTSRENGQHVAQPGVPGMQRGMPGRGGPRGMGQAGMGRPGMPQGAVAPGRVAPQQGQGDPSGKSE